MVSTLSLLSFLSLSPPPPLPPLPLSPLPFLTCILSVCRKNFLTWLILFSTVFSLLQLANPHVPALTTISVSFLGVLAGFFSSISVCSPLPPPFYFYLLLTAPPVSSWDSLKPPLCWHSGSGWGTMWACLLRSKHWKSDR